LEQEKPVQKKEKPKNKEDLKPLIKLAVIFSPIITILLIVIFLFIILLAPFAVIGFIFYGLYDLIYKVKRMKINSQFEEKLLKK
jgi:hypothetical protein